MHLVSTAVSLWYPWCAIGSRLESLGVPGGPGAPLGLVCGLVYPVCPCSLGPVGPSVVLGFSVCPWFPWVRPALGPPALVRVVNAKGPSPFLQVGKPFLPERWVSPPCPRNTGTLAPNLESGQWTLALVGHKNFGRKKVPA